MRESFAVLCLVSMLLVAPTSSTAMGRGNEPTAEFTNQLNDVREDDAQADLLNLFIRERENQLQITAATEPDKNQSQAHYHGKRYLSGRRATR